MAGDGISAPAAPRAARRPPRRRRQSPRISVPAARRGRHHPARQAAGGPARLLAGPARATVRMAAQEEEIEHSVSDHIRAMPFLCLGVPDRADRGSIERNSIARREFQGIREVRHAVIRVITEHLRDPEGRSDPKVAGVTKHVAPVSWQGQDLDFHGVVFDGGTFSDACFSGGNVEVSNAEFCGDVSFHHADFYPIGVVDFRQANFSAGGQVDFRHVKFSGGTVELPRRQVLRQRGPIRRHRLLRRHGQLHRCQVLRRAGPTSLLVPCSPALRSASAARSPAARSSFSDAKFSGATVSFHARFRGAEVSFLDATFSAGTVSFTDAVFSGGKVNFVNAAFSGAEVSFGATFSGGTVSFAAAKFSGGKVGFPDAVFSGGEVGFGAKFSGGTVSFPVPSSPAARSASPLPSSPAARSTSPVPSSPAARSTSAIQTAGRIRRSSTGKVRRPPASSCHQPSAASLNSPIPRKRTPSSTGWLVHVRVREPQFRETLPLLDLNLTGHAENPRGWTATRIEAASAKAWTTPACTYRTSGSAGGRCVPWSVRTAQADIPPRWDALAEEPYLKCQPQGVQVRAPQIIPGPVLTVIALRRRLMGAARRSPCSSA